LIVVMIAMRIGHAAGSGRPEANLMDLDVRHLRLVTALAATGNMTRAAHQLHLTQSALSHQLRDIEDRLGRRLFERESKLMRPTPAGQHLLETARRVLADLERTEQELRDGGRPSRQSLRISTECYTCYHWLPDLLKAFRRKHPLVDVEIVADATRRPLPSLLDGKLDLAIVVDQLANRRIEYRPLFADELVAVLPAGHRLTGRPYLVAADLEDEHLLVYDAPRSELSIFTEVLDPAGVTPREVSRIQLTEAIVEMVKAGLGVGVMARWAIAPHVEAAAVAARPLTKKGLHRRWHAGILRKRVVPGHLTDFIAVLAEKSLPAVYRPGRRSSVLKRGA
jgi:LysR family transcriptional regulator for metE and metH